MLPNGTLAAAGSFVWTLRRGNDSLVTPSNEGWNPYLVILDTLGNHLWFDQLHGLGFVDNALSGATDNTGNFYIGGQFESNITATGLGTGLSSTGGNTDFFIMKYGYPCNCPAPVAHFNAGTPSGKTVTYTYSGSTSGVDSLVWSFGDGGKQTVKSGFSTPVSHSFAANGRYTVCVTTYSNCGTNTYCAPTPLSVSGMEALGGVSVYPNPAQEALHIEGGAGAGYILNNAIGQQVLQGSIRSAKEEINIGALPAGSYLLQLTDREGRRGVMRVVKR
ncbi:MAG: T9SS type A sorting domain-containing protein [Bacteroidetes bacterium]|nr:T9SS type A sorting domain-containing protein [Bacteroidota bacterium]